MKGGEFNLKIEIPENSKNRVIKSANLLKRAFAKWETLPRQTRNLSAGIACLVSGLMVPKAIFLLLIASVCAGRHVYLNGEIEEAVKEIVVHDKDHCSPESSCADTRDDIFHP